MTSSLVRVWVNLGAGTAVDFIVMGPALLRCVKTLVTDQVVAADGVQQPVPAAGCLARLV